MADPNSYLVETLKQTKKQRIRSNNQWLELETLVLKSLNGGLLSFNLLSKQFFFRKFISRTEYLIAK